MNFQPRQFNTSGASSRSTLGTVEAPGTFRRVATALFMSDGSQWLRVGPVGSGGGARPQFQGAQVTRSANLSIPSVPVSPGTQVPWQSAAYDFGGFFNAANPTRLTVPTGLGGVYLLVANAKLDDNATGQRFLQFFFPGLISFYAYESFGAATSPNAIDIALRAETIRRLSPGDFIELDVFQNSGVALNLIADGEGPNFSMQLLRPDST